MPNLALFDFDGTITDTDMFSPFLTFAARKKRKIIGNIVILPFYLLYKAGELPTHIMRPIASFVAFSYRNQHELERYGVQYAKRVIPDCVMERAKEQLEWHKANGDVIVVVSASLDLYLKPWCKANGFQLLCSELSMNNNQCSGRYINGDCSRNRKAVRVTQAFKLADFDRIYAYGDTQEDRELLNLADEAYLNWSKL
ncbi:HAD-IB family hydrolase [Parashewanella curva]|uniref:HAD-IB family hydrolase n=1 Tax=Parashewanella curva TaxID=2338552 RepID=A0A3L8Q0E4_9GAMM|nr:HAD-IB family hydrolase [Parashewanella curva]RLV61137.1 HAD-IB family hydrolase [Parashewanella curva]